MADFSAKHYQIKSEKNATRAEEAADRAEEVKNIAVEAVTKLNEIDTTVDNAKAEITTYANSATNNAVIEIDNTANTYSKEIGYLNGVTSNIQTQLNGKASTANAVTASGSNYIKFGNGIIIQWGTSTSIDASQAITLPVPMTTASYAIIPQYAAGSAAANSGSVVTARTTTSFTVYWGSGSGARKQSFLSWIVVGK